MNENSYWETVVDKSKDHDGPTMAVLVREYPTTFGPVAVEVVSVHPDEEAAALGLAREIVKGGVQPGDGWRVVTVPATPTAAGEPGRLDPERLEDAARVVAGGQGGAPMTPGAWASYDGDLQEQWAGFAARVVTAYLQGEDG